MAIGNASLMRNKLSIYELYINLYVLVLQVRIIDTTFLCQYDVGCRYTFELQKNLVTNCMYCHYISS